MAGKAGAIRAGRAFVELFTDNSAYVRGLKQAKAQLQAFASFVNGMGRQLMAGGAAVLGAFGGAVAMFAKTGDDLADMAGRTGVAVESLQRLKFAAEQNGSTIEDLEGGVRVMQRSLFDLSRGSTSAVENFRDLGLTWDDLRSLSPEDQFKMIADRVAAIEDPTTRAAMAMKVFGRGGTALLPLLNQGAAGIEALGREFESLGMMMTTEQVAAAAELNDLWAKLTFQFKSAVVQIGSALSPAITTLSTNVSDVMKHVVEWIRENAGVIETVAKVTLGVTALGAAMVAIGPVIGATGLALGALATTVGAVSAAVTFLMTPLGLLAGSMVAVTAGVGHFTGAFADARREIMALGPELSRTWEAVKSLLAAGDVENALRTVVAGMKFMWFSMLDDLKNAWNAFWLDDSFEITLHGPDGQPLRVWRHEATQTFDEVSDATKAAAEELRQLQAIGAKAANVGNPLEMAVRRRAAVDENQTGLGMLFGGMPMAFAGGGSSGVSSQIGIPEMPSFDLPEETKAMIKGFKASIGKDAGKDLLMTPVEKMASEGTFSAFQAEAFGTGADSAAEQTARNTQRIVLNTEETARELRNGRAIVR